MTGAANDDGWEIDVEYTDAPAPRATHDLAAPDDSVIAEAEARFESLSKALDEQLSAIDELTSAMDVLQTEHGDPDGGITATVDVGGLLSGLVLTPEALERDPGALAHAIVMTARGAQQAHEGKLQRTKEALEAFRRNRSMS